MKELNGENESLKQKMANLENEKNGLEKAKTNKVLLENSKVAYVGLTAMLAASSILSVAFGSFILSIITTSATFMLIAGGAYAILKPATELKEVDVRNSELREACIKLC